MNNTDFQRLLLTDDKSLISELTKAPKKKGKEKAKGKGGGKGGKGAIDKDEAAKRRIAKRLGKGGGKGGDEEEAEGGVDKSKYVDRAKARRELSGEYERIAAEWENHGEVSVEQSKYLGGDTDHTHLVKGLDYALLSKVRTELTKKQRAQQIHQQRAQQKVQKKRTFQTMLARKVWNSVVETLHPHHTTFKQRLQRMGKAISMGQRIRGAPSTFLPGRMAYEFDIEVSHSSLDIPRIIYMSKEDAPKVDWSKKVASILPETAARVREALQRAIEERKQRKREKTMGAEASYTVAQKIVTKHKAKDPDSDIFAGVGGYDTNELARKTKSKAGAEVAPLSSSQGGRSYFDDAGSEKYKKEPEGQIDPLELEVDERDHAEAAPAPGGSDATCSFEAAERFMGARKGWVFKLGPQGLGYYAEEKRTAAAAAAAAAAPAAAGERRPLRTPRAPAATRSAPAAEDDAYGECFPDSGLGHALVATGDADSDAEDDEDGKKKKGLLGKKKGQDAPDSVAANRGGPSDGKKRKLNEKEQWQKIDHMIKKGKHSSMEELENFASKNQKRKPPAPREIMSTPAYF